MQRYWCYSKQLKFSAPEVRAKLLNEQEISFISLNTDFFRLPWRDPFRLLWEIGMWENTGNLPCNHTARHPKELKHGYTAWHIIANSVNWPVCYLPLHQEQRSWILSRRKIENMNKQYCLMIFHVKNLPWVTFVGLGIDFHWPIQTLLAPYNQRMNLRNIHLMMWFVVLTQSLLKLKFQNLTLIDTTCSCTPNGRWGEGLGIESRNRKRNRVRKWNVGNMHDSSFLGI